MLGKNNLREKAYELIKNKIISCEIMPGSPVVEKELMEEIGASRTPIREALSKLENDNLVKIFPKRGVFVTDITIKDVIDIYTVRESLEPLAARLATPHIDLEKLHKFYLVYTNPQYNPSLKEHIDTDREFHTFIARSTNNELLLDILLGLYDHTNRARILALKHGGRINKAREEHLNIVKCLMEKDEKKAEEAMRTHIVNAKSWAVQTV